MIRKLKKILLGSLSILCLSTLVWIVLLTNPSLSYAHEIQFGQVTVYHNNQLEEATEVVIKNAIELIKTSDIYDENFHIQLCLNDDRIYPSLHPTPGGTAYAFLNKTVVYASKPNFEKNITEFSWEINNNELRRFNLTKLLAHEFMHNLQYQFDAKYSIKKSIGKPYWKLEGHAEYIARSYKNDGKLKEKINFYLSEENKDHARIPVFALEDGTIHNLSYFKFALVIQYLFEIKQLNYGEICNLDSNIGEYYDEMIEWSIKSER